MRELALFAGAGGGILGGVLLGWRTVCAVELNTYCARRLMQRQNEGHLPPFPIWDDVCTFDGRPWRGRVDVVSGGFPCQDISVAGKGAGITGERSGLWGQMARIIREVQPRYAFVENSPALTVRGLGTVLGDLAEMGMDARWGVLGAIHVGAPHRRERIWIMAHSKGSKPRVASERGWGKNTGGGSVDCRGDTRKGAEDRSHSKSADAQDANGKPIGSRFNKLPPQSRGVCMWSTEPDVGRVAHGVAHRVDRLKAIGNGQVPAVVALAWETLRPWA